LASPAAGWINGQNILVNSVSQLFARIRFLPDHIFYFRDTSSNRYPASVYLLCSDFNLGNYAYILDYGQIHRSETKETGTLVRTVLSAPALPISKDTLHPHISPHSDVSTSSSSSGASHLLLPPPLHHETNINSPANYLAANVSSFDLHRLYSTCRWITTILFDDDHFIDKHKSPSQGFPTSP
jgi:hypothetical protein